MEKYLQNGKEIFDEYCSSTDNTPTMLPRAPKQTYIDVYPDEELSFRDDRHRQSDYEAEVKVYRALERLEETCIVLHSFKYTHHQYRICDKNHVRKRCSGCKSKKAISEGECDFVIICENCFVIIEVKNMEHVGREVVKCEPDFHLCTIDEDRQEPECKTRDQQLDALNKTLEKSVKQRNKIAELIKCMDKNAKILQFTAYPNFRKQYKEEFEMDQKSTIIFKEDLDNFNDWWTNNVKFNSEILQTSPSFKHEDVRSMLLAIWCTEENECDQSRCSFGKYLKNIDQQLKGGQFTFEPKDKEGTNRCQNPGVEKAPDVIEKYLKIENVTTQQKQVFDSNENLLWINGPAGAGKTVILYGKILELVQSDGDKKVLLFRSTGEGSQSQFYQTAFEKAHVKSKVENYRDITSSLLSDSNIQVIIVEITDHLSATKITDQLSSIAHCHLIFDDVQKVLYYSKTEEYSVFIDRLKELSLNRIVWIACDMVQGWRYLGKQYTMELANNLSSKLSSSQLQPLSMNLRNTCDLSCILGVIRDQFIYKYHSERRRTRINDPVDMLLPGQTPGHFIHGPKTVMHVLNNYDVNTIGDLLETELAKLGKLDDLCDIDISNKTVTELLGVVYNSSSREVASLVEKTVNNSNHKTKIAVCDSVSSYSAEWPAVVVLHQIWGDSDNDLPTLYLAISRARVHCSVILYPDEGETSHDNRDMQDLLDKLKDYAHVIYKD